MLYTKGTIDEKMRHLAQNKDTAEDFNKALDGLKKAAEGRDILIQTYGDGIMVHEVDPMTEKTKLICKDNDFIEGMQKAPKKIEEFYKKPEPKTPRVRFPGRNTGAAGAKLDTIA